MSRREKYFVEVEAQEESPVKEHESREKDEEQALWKQSFMMNQQWFKGVLMITMMTTKDDDKVDEQKAQKIKEQLKWIKGEIW